MHVHAQALNHALEASPIAASPASGEQRIVLYGVTWKNYVLARRALARCGLRMTYLEGALELMSTSYRHEDLKTTIARLIEIYALERDIALYGYGQATFQYEARKRGCEPDECYTLGRPIIEHEKPKTPGQFPDLVLEVVLTHGGIDKLEVYQGFEIPEVWFWQNDALEVHRLGESGYERAAGSGLLPDLDLEVLARHARQGDQHEAVRGFRDWLREGAQDREIDDRVISG